MGDEVDAIARVFSAFGEVERVEVADPSKARALVTMSTTDDASRAMRALHNAPCDRLAPGRVLHVQFSSPPRYTAGARGEEAANTAGSDDDDENTAVGGSGAGVEGGGPCPGSRQEDLWCPAVRDSDALGVPGATLVTDFVTPSEEAALLGVIDEEGADRWERLAKRRVMHFGFAFDYGTRDARRKTAPFPRLVDELLDRASRLEGVDGAERASGCDQLTVNEYAAGVGIAPHIDTHSAFGPTLLSVSLAGHAAMEFRLLPEGASTDASNAGGSDRARPVARASILLPPRSLLVMTGEARYRWQHYIPHRKRDAVAGESECAFRESRRVSLTLRETRREGPCECEWPEGCDSRNGAAQALKKRTRPGAVAAAHAAAGRRVDDDA